jgi:hypothetical protein
MLRSNALVRLPDSGERSSDAARAWRIYAELSALRVL